MIEKLPRFSDSIGDDDPYVSLRYGRVPEGFGFSALPVPDVSAYPLSSAAWPDLVAFADKHYRNWEVVGDTLTDFQMNLEDAWEDQADTFERLLEVYHDDIAKPILGRTEKTTYDLTNEGTGTSKNTASGGTTNNQTVTDKGTGKGETVNVPLDAPANDQPNGRTKSSNDNENVTDGSTTNYSTTEDSSTDTAKQTGTVITELSDLGVRPNYESLNGFLDENRTAKQVFAAIFKECFTLLQYQTF